MFCPRCGRPVSDIANFCGGCGLPRAEIEKANRNINRTENITGQDTPEIDIDNINREITQLEKDLTGVSPLNDYTTDTAYVTNNISATDDFVQQERNEESKDSYTAGYNYNRNNSYDPPKSNRQKEQNLSTVDFIWMMLISSLPVVGTIYVLWLAFVQKENVNKKSYARAILIISLFSFLLVFVFAMGLIFSQISMFY